MLAGREPEVAVKVREASERVECRGWERRENVLSVADGSREAGSDREAVLVDRCRGNAVEHPANAFAYLGGRDRDCHGDPPRRRYCRQSAS